jgi:hypothetical protein
MHLLLFLPHRCNYFNDVLSPKRRSLLISTLRRLVFVKMNMHLIPHDSLEETEMSEYSEGTDSWVQTIVEATEQYDLENELQSVVRHAKEDEVAGVNQDVGDLDAEQVGVDSLEGDE